MSSTKKPNVESSEPDGVPPELGVTHRVSLCSDNEIKPSKHTILNSVLRKLFDVTEEETLIYHYIDVERANDIIQELDRRYENRSLRLCYNSRLQELKLVLIPSKIHDSHQPWLHHTIMSWTHTGILPLSEVYELYVLSNTRFTSFQGVYASSRKEPDHCIMPSDMSLPTVVVESGWSESRPELYHDRDLWLIGGSGSVQVVIVLKWTKITQGRVKGDIEVFDLDASGNVRLLQQEVIFPTPPPLIAGMQSINITASQLFGPTLPAGQNPGTIFALSIDSLRNRAEKLIRQEGLIPA